LEEENLIKKPLFDEEHDENYIENIDSLLHIKRHKWDTIFFLYFHEDPIYDMDNDGFKDKIAHLWSCGQL
jgi:hypothetical protein